MSETEKTNRFTVTIERLGAGGDGVTKVGEATVYVAQTLPGDKVEIEIPQDGAGDRAKLVRVLESSIHRMAPPCSYFGQCGGCSLQHLQPVALGAWKRSVIASALRHRGIEATVCETIQVPAGDRRRAVFKAVKKNGRLDLGFNAPASHAVIDVDNCLLLAKPLNRMINPLRGSLHGLLPERGWAKVYATLTHGGVDLAIDASLKVERSMIERVTALLHDLDLARLVWNSALLAQKHKPVVMIDGIAVHPPTKAFLQASRAGEQHLIEFVRQAAGEATRVVDLFSGIGTFTLPMARTAQVIAYDSAATAVDALDDAVRRMDGLRPVKATVRDLYRMPVTAEELSGAEVAIFDPPRAGAEAQARQLGLSDVPVVIAVACDPGTFARDARILMDGGYRLQAVQPVDQFVWSSHIELVARFARETS